MPESGHYCHAMNLALLAAAGIAVSYGLATVLQSVGARSTASSEGLDPGLMVRLLRSVPYLIGLALDAAGFLLTVVALQSLPLFVVEAFTAGALAVTAVAAAVWLKLPLSRAEWIGVAAVVLGLVALGLSAGADEEVALATWARWLPLVAGLVLLLLTYLGAKVGGRLGVTVLGALAGFGFGLVGIATRTLESPISVTGLLTDPSAYGIVVAGGVALLALATALQRGAVTQATAAMVVAETVIPSAIGLLFLGDRIRPGFEVIAGVGLLLAISGAVALARLGELPEEDAGQASAPGGLADPTPA
jgi:drug/metabolite transporter (DMT)-like permease